MMARDDIYCHVHLLSKSTDDKADFETYLARPVGPIRHKKTYFCLSEISLPNFIESTYVEGKVVKPSPTGPSIKKLPELGFYCPFLTDTLVSPGKFLKLFLKEGWYSPKSICETLNKTLADKLGPKFNTDLCHFVYNDEKGIVQIYVNGGADAKKEEKVTLVLKAQLSYLLGFMAYEDETLSRYFVCGATTRQFPVIEHQTKAFGRVHPKLSDSFDFIFIYCDKVIASNIGEKQCSNLLSLVSRDNMVSSKNYLTFRPVKLQYIPVLDNIDWISSISIKIANENGAKLNITKGGSTETRISLHICTEKYLT